MRWRLVSLAVMVQIGPLLMVSSTQGQQATIESPLAGSKINTFVENTRDRPPRENLTRALQMFAEELEVEDEQARPLAADLGAGAGNETRYLIGLGWDVIAVDPAPVAIEAIQETVDRLKAVSPNRTFGTLDCRTQTMQQMRLRPASVRLMNASFSLPYVPQDEMDTVWQKCVDALKEGGVFTGHFFGPDHEWRDNPHMSFFSVKQLYRHLIDEHPLELRYLHHKRETVNLAVGGEAYFDTITVIVQKVAPTTRPD